MTETYRIKPLEWYPSHNAGLAASTPLGFAWIVPTDGRAYQWAVGHVRRASQAPTLEAAKTAAEAHYRERMREGLELVDVGIETETVL